MKTYVCVLLLVVSVVAEPPRYRQARFQPEKQQSGNEAGAPYPAAGFKPDKEFKLPTQQDPSPPVTSYGVPENSYSAPFNTYASPQTQYGPPEKKDSGKGNKEVENIKSNDGKEQKGKLEQSKKDTEVVSAQGAYYVLLPGSQLQRVQFQTENDIRNMAYTARLQYKNEDRAPIFVYNTIPQYQPTAAYIQLVR